MSEAMDVLVAETEDAFGGRPLYLLSKKEQHLAVQFLVDLGALELRESALRIAAAFGKSRVWVYNSLNS